MADSLLRQLERKGLETEIELMKSWLIVAPGTNPTKEDPQRKVELEKRYEEASGEWSAQVSRAEDKIGKCNAVAHDVVRKWLDRFGAARCFGDFKWSAGWPSAEKFDEVAAEVNAVAETLSKISGDLRDAPDPAYQDRPLRLGPGPFVCVDRAGKIFYLTKKESQKLDQFEFEQQYLKHISDHIAKLSTIVDDKTWANEVEDLMQPIARSGNMDKPRHSWYREDLGEYGRASKDEDAMAQFRVEQARALVARIIPEIARRAEEIGSVVSELRNLAESTRRLRAVYKEMRP